MSEHIYTIPINDHFGKADGCALCSLFNMLERNEIERITGAAMMEPDVRIQTNRFGFCERHFGKMLLVGKRLPVALILQSHFEIIRGELERKKPEGQGKYLQELENSCYVCGRIQEQMDSLYGNLFWLWSNDRAFQERFRAQPYFCFPHYRELLFYGQKHLSKKDYRIFCAEVWSIETSYLETLSGDIDWFCKKFDYRFAKEDWKNSKDAIERAVYTLTGHMPEFRSEISTTI